MKDTKGKLDYTLLCWDAIEELVKVRHFGVKKYKSRDSWKSVDKQEYIKAIFRHLTAYLNGEQSDKETGLNHIAHLMCNCMFIVSMDKELNLTAIDAENFMKDYYVPCGTKTRSSLELPPICGVDVGNGIGKIEIDPDLVGDPVKM